MGRGRLWSSESWGDWLGAKNADSTGSLSLENGTWSVVGGRVDRRGIDTVCCSDGVTVTCRLLMAELSSVSSCGLHQAIRLTTSSHSSRLTMSLYLDSSSPFPVSCFAEGPWMARASMFNISWPNHLPALMDRCECTSLCSYIPVTTVSAHPMSTINAVRKPAARVITAGDDKSEMVGGWKFSNKVSRIVESNGRGSMDGNTNAIRLGRESMSRNLGNPSISCDWKS